MIEKGFLATNYIFIASTAHKMNIVDKYLKILDKIFYNISLHENKKIDLEK